MDFFIKQDIPLKRQNFFLDIFLFLLYDKNTLVFQAHLKSRHSPIEIFTIKPTYIIL